MIQKHSSNISGAECWAFMRKIWRNSGKKKKKKHIVCKNGQKEISFLQGQLSKTMKANFPGQDVTCASASKKKKKKKSCLFLESEGPFLVHNRQLRVCTHQQSQVESNPVQSDSQRRTSHSVAYSQWLPRQCVHTSRIELSRVESSRVPRVLFSQES